MRLVQTLDHDVVKIRRHLDDRRLDFASQGGGIDRPVCADGCKQPRAAASHLAEPDANAAQCPIRTQPVERCADAGFGLLRVQPVQQQDRPSLRILG